jgi:hypothetical protein
LAVETLHTFATQLPAVVLQGESFLRRISVRPYRGVMRAIAHIDPGCMPMESSDEIAAPIHFRSRTPSAQSSQR